MEINYTGFEVQRKQENTWNKIAFIQGNGTTNAPKEYSYTDEGLGVGTYVYRLK